MITSWHAWLIEMNAGHIQCGGEDLKGFEELPIFIISAGVI